MQINNPQVSARIRFSKQKRTARTDEASYILLCDTKFYYSDVQHPDWNEESESLDSVNVVQNPKKT